MRVKLSWLNELVNISDLKVEELKRLFPFTVRKLKVLSKWQRGRICLLVMFYNASHIRIPIIYIFV